VPPQTGWELLVGGETRAIATWEGNPQLPGERSEPEQALCFGAELSGAALLQGDGAGEQLAACARELLAPLLERWP
jgi:exodeoxyribonuclease V gamma subunit